MNVDSRPTFNIDSCTRLHDGRLVVQGWADTDDAADPPMLRAVQGAEWVPALRYRRVDVAAFLGAPDDEFYGMTAIVDSSAPGDTVDLELRRGTAVECVRCSVDDRPTQVDFLLSNVDLHRYDLSWVIEEFVRPLMASESPDCGVVAETYRSEGYPDQVHVNVVIPIFGNFDFLGNILQWHAATRPRDVAVTIVSDDPRVSGPLARWLRDWNDSLYLVPIRLLTHSSNGGFARAVNTGTRDSSAPFQVLWNSDVVPLGSESVIDRLIDGMGADVVATAPVLLFPDGSIQHAGITLGPYGGDRRFTIASHPRKGHEPGLLGHHPFDVDFASAAFLVIRTGAFIDVGGMPEQFGKGDFEDVLLSRRLGELGRLTVNPNVRLMHAESWSYDRSGQAGQLRTLARSALLMHLLPSRPGPSR